MKDPIGFLFTCWKVKTMKECIQLLPRAETNSNKLLTMPFWGSKGDPVRESKQASGSKNKQPKKKETELRPCLESALRNLNCSVDMTKDL